jgi:uncharacterized protein YjdB
MLVVSRTLTVTANDKECGHQLRMRYADLSDSHYRGARIPTLSRGGVLLLLILASACGRNSTTSPTPTSVTITLTSPNTIVLVGATEQMTATSSDGRTLTGTWSTDDTAVATVSNTGLVTATGAGQATIIFTSSSGRVGAKLLHVLGFSISFQ